MAFAKARRTAIIVPGLFLNEDPSNFREAGRQLVARSQVAGRNRLRLENAAIALVAGLQDAGLVVGRDIDVVAKSTSDILDYLDAGDRFLRSRTSRWLARRWRSFLIKRIRGVPAVSKLQTVDHAAALCVRT